MMGTMKCAYGIVVGQFLSSSSNMDVDKKGTGFVVFFCHVVTTVLGCNRKARAAIPVFDCLVSIHARQWWLKSYQPTWTTHHICGEQLSACHFNYLALTWPLAHSLVACQTARRRARELLPLIALSLCQTVIGQDARHPLLAQQIHLCVPQNISVSGKNHLRKRLYLCIRWWVSTLENTYMSPFRAARSWLLVL